MPRKRARQTQHAAAEGSGEIRLQHDGHGHRTPIAARSADGARQRIGDRYANRQPQGVAAGGGIQRQVGAQHGHRSGQPQAPGLRGLQALEFANPGGARMRAQLHRRGELSGQRVELPAGVGERGGQRRSVVVRCGSRNRSAIWRSSVRHSFCASPFTPSASALPMERSMRAASSRAPIELLRCRARRRLRARCARAAGPAPAAPAACVRPG